MDNIIGNLWVGGDSDYESLGSRKGWSVLRCCKEGPGGHRETAVYTTLGAPKGPEYLAAIKGERMALNFIDANDPNFIPLKMIQTGLEYVDKKLSEGYKVLIACNLGHSRGPTTALLYLRSTGELDGNFVASERIFRTLYPLYSPGLGVRQFARSNWDTLKSAVKEANGTLDRRR